MANGMVEAAEQSYLNLCSDTGDESECDNDSKSSNDDALSSGPSKQKAGGAAMYKTKFNKDWMKKWPFICEVPNNVFKFRCTMCSRDVSCAHVEKNDVERHISKAMHKANVKALHSQRTFDFLPTSDPINDEVNSYVVYMHLNCFTCIHTLYIW